MRDDLRTVENRRQEDVELRLLVGRRGDIVTDATRRFTRLRDLLASIHPGLESALDVTAKTGMHLLTRYVTPSEIRRETGENRGCDVRSQCAVRRWKSKEVKDLLAGLSQQPSGRWAQSDPGDAGEGGKQRRQSRDGRGLPDRPGPASEIGRCTRGTSGKAP